MRILHTADWHLGQILYQYYDRTAEHDHFFRQLADWCREERPDALVVSGDVFDMQQPGAATKSYFNRQLVVLHRAQPDMAIVVTAGNHDSAARMEADSVVWAEAGVTVVGQPPKADPALEDEGWEDRWIVELPSGFIVAMPFAVRYRRDVTQALLDRVAERNTDQRPVVMMAHAAVAGCDLTGHSDTVGNQAVQQPDEMGTGFDYLALGHIHRPQTLGVATDEEHQRQTRMDAPVMRYSGSALHVSADERYPHTASLVDIDRHGGTVTLTRLRIDELRHFVILPPEGEPAFATDTEALSAIGELCSSGKRCYFRLRLDHSAPPMPPGFQQAIYSLIEQHADRVRFNPQHLWENVVQPESAAEERRFEVADLQQMTNPLDFIARTIDDYPGLDLESLGDDFAEIAAEASRLKDEEGPKRTKKSTQPEEA